MTTVVRSATYTFAARLADSSPGSYLPSRLCAMALSRHFKTSMVHSSGGIQASLLAYFAQIANVRLVLKCFTHCGSSAEPKAIR
jgi:hypothetical protein